MAESGSGRTEPIVKDRTYSWKYLDTVKTLKRHPCQHVHAKWGKQDDLVIMFVKERFFVMEAWCGHLGGPLFKGDIEDMKGKCYLMCPWHGYMFDVESGVEPYVGLQQRTFAVKIENGGVYVDYKCEISLKSYEEESNANDQRQTV